MAEEQVGPRPVAWTKIFSGFKVALDLKKLLLAGAGVFITALGWWILSFVAYALVSKPEWKGEGQTEQEKRAAFRSFSSRRAAWNLLHELAGDRPLPLEYADVAEDYQQYEALQNIKRSYDRYLSEKATVNDKENVLVVGGKTYSFTTADPKDADKLRARTFFVREIEPQDGDRFQLGGVLITVTDGKALRDYTQEGADLKTLRNYKRPGYDAALDAFEKRLLTPTFKPAGRLRTLPWFEERGQNPYLLVAGAIKATGDGTGRTPARLLAELLELVPVVLEPIVKVFTPIVYLFDRRTDWYVQGYLLLVLLYFLAVWGFFGGAISRLAAVQVARNEKIPLREAVVFAKDRFVSFFAAPAFPLLLLAILVFCLWIYGWLQGFTYWFGDIVFALLWPIVLIVGLIMAVVVVGLAGWPLMNPTISAEGSDSFDALSRSYSYVYQAPWHYVWYGLLATAYGMVLVFFVGFMASLIVFLGKWGVAAPGLAKDNPVYDREPSYMFYFAPTSFGWRDLLIHDNRFTRVEVNSAGVPHVEFEPEYVQAMSRWNYAGAIFVAFWIWLFFLLVVGFGYSYFWTAATIIYFLMRRHVDDTDMDEVHLEEDEAIDPFARPPGAPAAPPPGKSDKVSLSVVEPPPRVDGPPVPTAAPPASPAPPVSTAISEAPPAAPPAENRPTPGEPPPGESPPAAP